MDIIAAVLAYLGAVSGISIGLLTGLSMLLAPPAKPTSVEHVKPTTADLTQAMPLKTSAWTRSKAGRLTPRSDRLAQTEPVSKTKGAHYTRYQLHKTIALRKRSRDEVLRDRSKQWAYRPEPDVFHRRSSYAQAFSGDFSRIW